jgi:hypothetical protein
MMIVLVKNKKTRMTDGGDGGEKIIHFSSPY